MTHDRHSSAYLLRRRVAALNEMVRTVTAEVALLLERGLRSYGLEVSAA